MRFSTATFTAIVAAIGAMASPVKKQNAEINDVTILNYACESASSSQCLLLISPLQ